METGKSALQFQVVSVLSRHRFYHAVFWTGAPHFVGEPVSWLSKVASILPRHRCCHAVFWRVHRASLGIPFLGFPKSNRPCQDVASAGPFSGPVLLLYYCCVQRTRRMHPLLFLKLCVAPRSREAFFLDGYTALRWGIRFVISTTARLLSVSTHHALRRARRRSRTPQASMRFFGCGDCRALATAFGMGAGERERKRERERERAYTPPAKSCLRVRMRSHARLSCAPSKPGRA